MLHWISKLKIRILNYNLQKSKLWKNFVFDITKIQLFLTPRLLFGIFESALDNEFVIKSYAMEFDSSSEWKTVTSGLTNTYSSTCEYFNWK